MWNSSISEAVTANGGYGLNVGPGVTLSDAATPYLVTPATPNCVYAGDPGQPDGSVPYTTQFLVFPDEATAIATLPELWTPDA